MPSTSRGLRVADVARCDELTGGFIMAQACTSGQHPLLNIEIMNADCMCRVPAPLSECTDLGLVDRGTNVYQTIATSRPCRIQEPHTNQSALGLLCGDLG